MEAPYPRVGAVRFTGETMWGAGNTRKLVGRGNEFEEAGLPAPSMRFRRRAWLLFQQALDPLAQPKPLPTKRRPQQR
jgi:hypothetical protein